MDLTISASDEPLRHWIREHAVCWEIAPVVELLQRREIRVGLELHLFGRGDFATEGPGGPEDRAIYRGLKTLVERAIPPELGSVRCEIGPDIPSYHYRRQTGWVPEVQLTLRLLHRSGYFSPIDADEMRCAREIGARLHSLGCAVQHGNGNGQGPPFR
jgi:hypothetical protein